jgi:hypothetical protein
VVHAFGETKQRSSSKKKLQLASRSWQEYNHDDDDVLMTLEMCFFSCFVLPAKIILGFFVAFLLFHIYFILHGKMA